VILGALAKGLTLPAEAWQEGIRQSVKPQFLDINLRAFQAGRTL
jgi:Pyruvate/2-oxoacid:ferredoxin oxidoreductase gamma subunit